MVRRLICTLLCLVTLVGCSNKEKPKQYVAELSHPYINSLPSAFNKENARLQSIKDKQCFG